MKILKRIGLVLLILLVILGGGGLLMPRHVALSRSKVIQASPQAIQAEIVDLRKWENWSPWAKLDTAMVEQFSENTVGVGANMSWDGNKDVGKGSMTITAATPDSIAQSMDFGMGLPATAAFYFEPEGNATKVTWSGHFDMGPNPFNHWFGLLINTKVGEDYDKGLNALAQVIEAK